MSDKSFGDHTNRNVVKNPLLSTAVTGLSLEDLTHNAVLLPVAQTQELITRQDQQGFQSIALGQSEPKFHTSGDLTSITHPNPPPTTGLQDRQHNDKSMSKASVKSEDDFDVEEYFARLQGTRYVSAPINSTLKEVPQVNLQATEENLEEINLNEPEKSPAEQQSLTADIAQNFSQLPTVLPQVASAVFSSFSNILNYKSREQTPDERGVQKEFVGKVEEVGVPLMGVDDPVVQREVAPPPRELPFGGGGASNFRITTKKKAYAQIPGLSSAPPVGGQASGVNPGMPGLPPMGHSYATQNIPIPGHHALNPGAHLYQIPSSQPSGADTYQIHASQAPKPGYYPGSTPGPNVDIPGVSPTSPYSQIPGLGYAEMPNQNVPLHLARTTPTMCHDYAKNQRRQSSEHSTFLHEGRESLTAQPLAVDGKNQKYFQGQGQIFDPFSSQETISAQNPSQVTMFQVGDKVSDQNNSHPISHGVPPSSTSVQDSFVFPKQMLHHDHHNTKIEEKMLNPLDSFDDLSIHTTLQPTNQSGLAKAGENTERTNDKPTPIKESNSFTTVEQNAQQLSSQAISHEQTSVPSTSIIPPPPMFSNLPRKDTSSTGKSVLPPSVARRIGANHPIIRPQTMQPASSSAGANFFIPAPVSDETKSSPNASDPTKTDAPESAVSIPSAFVQFHASSPSVVDSKSGFRDGGITGVSIPYQQPPMRYANDSTHDFPPAWFPQSGQSNQPQTAVPFNPDPLNRPPPPSHQPMNITSQIFDQNPMPEAVKPVAEPPKVTGNLNYRMTKKRPQYYSGPIEGVGAISNNVKPVIPVAEPNAFQGALFIPNQQVVEQVPSVESAPFDISQPTNVTPYAQFDITHTQASGQPEYNTAFDLSRPTTETYEPKYEQSQESKGFGIIGSLKTKLSGLDINKIQNTVTTFFDPAYNDTKKEPETNQGVASYEYSQGNTPSFGQQDSSLEIFVPNNELSQTYTQGYNSQLNYPNYNYSQSNQYYQNQAYYTPDQAYQGSYGSPNYGTYLSEPVPQNTATYSNVYGQVPETQTSHTQQNVEIPKEELAQQSVQPNIDSQIKETVNSEVEPLEQDILKEQNPTDIGSAFIASSYNTYNLFLNNNEAVSTPVSVFSQINVDINKNSKPQNTNAANLEPKASLNFFDNEQFHSSPDKIDISDQFKDLTITKEEKLDTKPQVISVFSNNNIQSDTNSGKNFFENISSVADSFGDNASKNNPADSEKSMGNNLLQIQETQGVPTLDVSSVPLFDLSNMIAERAKEMTDLEDSVKNVNLKDKPVERQKLDSSSSAGIVENLSTVPQPLTDEENEGVSELSICETCREVTKTEDKEVDDLTKQLIENITSPIQLSNPVVAPLTESNTPVDSAADFESKQCAEISHITEETIEAIQVQSATELLDDIEEVAKTEVTNYGWATENTYVSPEVLLDHDYTFQMDPNALGFYGTNAMFFENIPNNASDELKAEFKSSQEDMPGPLPPQMSIPTAPPAEDDDTKSDETGGLDVHSIEQDAKKDFPIYEEYVIEPSGTDDDKIEFKERERSSDDPAPEVDSFTNRVERFKKLEETSVDKSEQLTEEQKNMLFDIASASQNIATPAITIASYFDTGNFAVESHYRNSLSSPSALHFQMGSPEIPLRIPPGFENEFKRRLSGLIAQDNTMHDTNNDMDKNITHIPETSTQTRPVVTTTYSSVASFVQGMVMTSSKMEPAIAENKNEPVETSLPAFASVFGRQDSGDAASSISKVEEKKEIPAASNFFAPEAEKVQTQTLPDPISFFSSGNETTNTEPDNNFNRLASYFATPPKTDPEKSFFELSQSQNHYRHSISNVVNDNAQNVQLNNNVGSFSPNIPHALTSLMSDLTSPQNIVTSKDQIIKTVNYFTVEYDTDEMKTFKLGEFKKDDDRLDKANISYPADIEESGCLNDEKVVTVISKCKYCCSNDSRRVVTLNKIELDNVEFEFRKVMNADSSEPSKTDTNQMEGRKDEAGKRREVTVTFGNTHEESDGVTVQAENRSSTEYTPVKHHWFYRVDVEGKSIWRGFSIADNRALEEAFCSPDLNENTVVPTDGGRYDVNVIGRLRVAVYWPDKPTNVRRCSWFYKGATLYVPYTEPVAEKLEEEYRHGVTTGEWHRRLVLPNNESVVMHGPQVMVHFPQSATDTFSSAPLFAFGRRVYRNPPKIKASREQSTKVDHLLLLVHGAGEYRSQKEKESTMRPRVVRRGCDETEIEDPEPSSIDHLLLLCHGVGSACDMRFRSVEEVVDDFRATSLQLVQSHYRNSYDKGVVNRVEVLPISWHSSLHSGETGVDKRLAEITLESIPRLRSFTNDTVLDVLLYTSPVFCQTIIDTVCAELNRIYKLFKQRNPGFRGEVSLGGHSLGSVILYDLLCHQIGAGGPGGAGAKSFVRSPAGSGPACVRYPPLDFTPAALYAFGSPIAMFECIRGVKTLGADFSLPTCKNFFNIFHPYDPIAYRIEPLINSQLGDVKPFLIPHHKGRKRMHLELKDTMARVGADLKQKLMESIKATWTSMWKTQPPPNDGHLEKVVEEEMEKEQLCEEAKEDGAQNEEIVPTPELLGHLNAGRRVDYVLQEAPFEMINEYLFAMSSHVCYWESEDTMLLILREIYDTMGVQPDCTVPQQTMTVHRTRVQAQDDAVTVETPDNPSTSRGGT